LHYPPGISRFSNLFEMINSSISAYAKAWADYVTVRLVPRQLSHKKTPGLFGSFVLC